MLERPSPTADRGRRRGPRARGVNQRPKYRNLATSVSHELRGPINVIAGWMNILLAAGPTPEATVLSKALTAIGGGFAAQTRLISDLLDHSRIVAGKLELRRAAIDLLTLAEAALVGVRAGGDEAEARAALVGLLERYGAIVRIAGSVGEAMASLAADLPDVMISDLGMCGEDGYDIIRRIRLQPEHAGGRLPSLAVSAYATAEHRKRVMRSGYQAYLESQWLPPNW
jgi:CheY-like chemotaxis protein